MVAAFVIVSGQCCPGWGVIGRTLQFTGGSVNAGCGTGFCQHFREQDVIDAQALIFLETEHSVIPPGVGFFRLLEKTEAVFQAEADQALKRRAFGFGAKNAAGPGFGVVHIAVCPAAC